MKGTSPDACDGTNNVHNSMLPSVHQSAVPKGCGTICDLTTTDFEATLSKIELLKCHWHL